jgi:hypothetical protein
MQAHPEYLKKLTLELSKPFRYGLELNKEGDSYAYSESVRLNLGGSHLKKVSRRNSPGPKIRGLQRDVVFLC